MYIKKKSYFPLACNNLLGENCSTGKQVTVCCHCNVQEASHQWHDTRVLWQVRTLTSHSSKLIGIWAMSI